MTLSQKLFISLTYLTEHNRKKKKAEKKTEKGIIPGKTHLSILASNHQITTQMQVNEYL